MMGEEQGEAAERYNTPERHPKHKKILSAQETQKKRQKETQTLGSSKTRLFSAVVSPSSAPPRGHLSLFLKILFIYLINKSRYLMFLLLSIYNTSYREQNGTPGLIAGGPVVSCRCSGGPPRGPPPQWNTQGALPCLHGYTCCFFYYFAVCVSS